MATPRHEGGIETVDAERERNEGTVQSQACPKVVAPYLMMSIGGTPLTADCMSSGSSGRSTISAMWRRYKGKCKWRLRGELNPVKRWICTELHKSATIVIGTVHLGIEREQVTGKRRVERCLARRLLALLGIS